MRRIAWMVALCVASSSTMTTAALAATVEVKAAKGVDKHGEVTFTFE